MKFFITILLALLLSPGWTQKNDSDDWLVKLDQYQTESLDSVEKYVAQLLSLENSLVSMVLIKQASAYVNFNKFQEADSVIKLISTDLNAKDEFHYYRIKGKVANEKDQNDEALEHFYKALEIAQSNDLAELEPEIYFEIAPVLRKNNDLENCTKYYRYAIAKAREVGNLDLEVRSNIQMCKVYNGWIIVNLDSSLYYGERARQLSLDKNYEYGYANSISIVCAPIIRKGQYRRGLEMSKEALKYADKYNFSLMNRYYLIANLGFAYEGLKMYDSALFFMKKAGQLRPESLDYPRLKYRIYKAQGKYKDALEALEDYFAQSDSTLRNRNKTHLSNLQARYEANLKENELMAEKERTALQEVELDQQRYLIVGMILISVLLIFALVLGYRQKKLKQTQEMTSLQLKQTKERLNIEQQYRESELKALRSQMNPHFIFNALNSIQEYIVQNEKKLAGKYLGKFADLMRLYLQHSQARTITLQQEIDALKLYLELEKLRFEDTLDYSLEITEGTDTEIKIPSLLIQPYVENALKHGLLHKKEDRELRISFNGDERNEELICEVVDNGIGREQSKKINQNNNPTHKPFAIGANEQRINLLNHGLKRQITLSIEDRVNENGEPSGTHVKMVIPIMQSGDWETQTNHSEIDLRSKT
jgi:tetratricopeptide (TPR) repeat protein